MNNRHLNAQRSLKARSCLGSEAYLGNQNQRLLTAFNDTFYTLYVDRSFTATGLAGHQQIDDLNELTDTLSNDRAQQWFLRGAGAVLIGLLLGFWVARRIYHKRYHGGWL